jgi:hypothetical protein
MFKTYLCRSGQVRAGAGSMGEGERRRSEEEKKMGERKMKNRINILFPQVSFPIFYVNLLGVIAAGTVDSHRVQF